MAILCTCFKNALMKKFFIIIVTLLFVVHMNINACPFCGCGVGGFYIGLLPAYKTSFFGVRYETMSYSTHVKADATQFSYDHYKIAELWGGVSLGKKWQMLGFLPYHINLQNTDDGTVKQNGIGDATIIANYRLWQTSKVNFKSKSLFKQELWLGGGVKLPTGKYNVDLADPDTELGDVNSQMGTGSVDFIVNSTYKVTINRFGINTTAAYKANTVNHSQFKYGNRFTANSFGFYQAAVKKVNLAPNIGVLYEDAAINRLQKGTVDETGGYVAFAAAGLEVNIKKITIGGNFQQPFSQNFAHGQTVAKTRGTLHLSVSL